MYACGRSAKMQTVELLVVTRLPSIKSQEQARETAISYTILPTQHSGQPSSGFSGNNQITNPGGKVRGILDKKAKSQILLETS